MRGDVIASSLGSINLDNEYRASMGAGTAPDGKTMSEITIYQQNTAIHLSVHHLSREKVLGLFPKDTFVFERVYSIDYGIPGYELDSVDPSHMAFTRNLLTRLYQKREKNIEFRIYDSFPWEQSIRTPIAYIRKVDEKDEVLDQLREKVTVSGENYEVCGAQVIVSTAIDEDAKTTYILPLGYCVAKIEAFHYVATTTTSPALKQQKRCVIYGKDSNGNEKKIILAVFPNDPSDEAYRKLYYLHRFISHMSHSIT